jgi:hypothetical protein
VRVGKGKTLRTSLRTSFAPLEIKRSLSRTLAGFLLATRAGKGIKEQRKPGTPGIKLFIKPLKPREKK